MKINKYNFNYMILMTIYIYGLNILKLCCLFLVSSELCGVFQNKNEKF